MVTATGEGEGLTMCITCWTDKGSPTDWNPDVAKVVELIRHLYEDLGHSNGGQLHAVLDDYNVEDEHIVPWWLGDDGPDEMATVNELVERLTSMTIPERLSAIAHYDGFVREGVPVEFVNGEPVEPETRYVLLDGNIWVPEEIERLNR
jgi:hypothetical protein